MSPPRQSKPNIVIADAEYLKAMSGAKRALYLAGFIDRVGPVKGLVLPPLSAFFLILFITASAAMRHTRMALALRKIEALSSTSSR
jgi:hypothetical protein